MTIATGSTCRSRDTEGGVPPTAEPITMVAAASPGDKNIASMNPHSYLKKAAPFRERGEVVRRFNYVLGMKDRYAE